MAAGLGAGAHVAVDGLGPVVAHERIGWRLGDLPLAPVVVGLVVVPRVGWGGNHVGVLAANAKEAEEAADRKQKRQDRQPEREDAHNGSGDETSMTQPGSGASAAPLDGQPEGAGRRKSRQDTDRRHPR
jgi:hypothetical protein